MPLDSTALPLLRLRTRKSEIRLVKDYFHRIHDSAGRIRETFFNLQGAMRMASNQDAFAEKWLEKNEVLQSIYDKLSEVESMVTVATAGVGTSFPVVSNLETVRAANKISRNN